MEGILHWLKSLDVTPTIVALRKRAEEIKQSEIEKAMGRLGHLPPQDRSAIEGLASAIVNKLLHGSLVTLKVEANGASSTMFVEAAKRFFNLDNVSSDKSEDVPVVSEPDLDREPSGKDR